jgi:hypothetical protein
MRRRPAEGDGSELEKEPREGREGGALCARLADQRWLLPFGVLLPLKPLALALEESLEEIGALLGHEAADHLRTVIHPGVS